MYGAAQKEWNEAIQAADESVTNSAVLVSSSYLTAPVVSGKVYEFELELIYSGSDATGDYRCNFLFPAATNGYHEYIGDNDASDAIKLSTGIRFANVAALAADILLGTDAAGGKRVFKLSMMIVAGATGNVVFQFANSAASTGRISTTKAGSRLKYRQLD